MVRDEEGGERIMQNDRERCETMNCVETRIEENAEVVLRGKQPAQRTQSNHLKMKTKIKKTSEL